MKQLVHISYTSHEEVCCRTENDYWIMISRIAQAAIFTDTEIYAYSVMSNHVHLVVATDNPGRFVSSIKKSYVQSFNHKYKRSGRLGEEGFYQVHLKGRDHILTALVYVLKNPWHHSVSENPYDYPFSSMNLYFRRNRQEHTRRSFEVIKSARLLNRNVTLPDNLLYGENGNIMPISFVQVEMVEHLFKTYNAFEYLTHRKSYNDMTKTQQENHPDIKPITLKSLEPLMNSEKISAIESGSYYWNKRNDRLSDIDLCKLIDTKYLARYHKETYTQLSKQERLAISNELLRKYQYRLTVGQIKRCLGR